MLKGDFSFANNWFKDNREKVFCIGLWLEMRNGYSTTTPRRKNTTLSPINRCHRPQHQHHGRTFMVRRSCSVSGGTKRILFTMSCWNLAIPLRAIGSGYILIHLSRALRKKRPEYEQRHDKVIFLHDNARPHVAKVVKKYLEMLKWNVLPHLPYFPDITLSDYWLFRRMQHDLTSHRFTSFTEIENWLQNWIAFKDESFFSRWNSKIAWKMGKSSRQR